MLALTNDARLAIAGLVQPIDPTGQGGVRIAIEPSLDGEGPQLGLAVASEPSPGDSVIDEDGARVFLDTAAAEMLGDRTLDARIDQDAQQVDFYLA
jgi:Fe-S cluster assembly iron-binding protein IscA